ncbi:MAG: DUF1992 domain-containing protein [Burkholderiales bacterium]|nr:DUF1992 domain-containing protein [Burkholderiales bacterium]MDE1927892.1 DUF1992 domain-containing protein [Burkholderiales bacterium]MDE2158642.1 DUF1992 domain-containing protein [Burkholderiales bacterium]MDE2501927.1 DUF1992 domain-containing protein [Burkholderiales bacterium]
MTAAERREQRLQGLEDEIGRKLAESEAEMRRAPSWGKPLDFGDGYDETPVEWRMGYKILKDAGVVPPEVELMQRIEALSRAIDGQTDPVARQAQRAHLVDLRQQLALWLERRPVCSRR